MAEGKFRDTALVTGASEGIGREFAKILAAEGHDLVIVARNEARLNELREELSKKHGVSVKVIPKDLSKINSVDELWEEIQREGIKVSVLINNAGYMLHGDFVEIDIEDQMDMVQVCVNALTRLMNYCLKDMVRAKNGKILNVSSIAGFVPCATNALYGASKSYVFMMSEAIAEEVAKNKVTVTALCPGPTNSQFFVRSKTEGTLVSKIGMMEPRDVAMIGHKAMMAGKRHVVPGLINKMMVNAGRMAPFSIAAKITKLTTI
ncbi:MAG: SDR family oxidoreductase [Actinobacteria bacterium]|nr:SDR family oxidoreductase [Actinomycetota bacterium]